jgi:indolepyruvate decarboxylase
MEAAYNDIANWKYKDLPTVFTDKDNYLSLSANTEAELEVVLRQAENSDKLVLVELHLDPFDAPKGLKSFGPAIANFDYGPLGPQRKA